MNKIDEIKKLLGKIKEHDNSFEENDSYSLYTDFDHIRESIKLILETFTDEFIESKSYLELSNIENELLEILHVLENLEKGLK